MEPRPSSLADAQKSLLAVIDCQERLWRVIERRDAVERAIRVLLEGAAAIGVPAILTEQYRKGLGPTIPGIREAAGRADVVPKMSFSCGGEPAFVDAVHAMERSTVVLAGVETHICVLQTALDLVDRGYDVHVAADACGTRVPANHELALARLARAGAVVTTVESVLFEWMGRCDHAAFKTVSGLLK